ncbi:MAG: NADPH:quinone oxidoreductase family protein [Alphaproteobacteria bacterium]|nr:NADPH:quinone oxidoreductase family protein [Alphaproteobacteria bacterium]MBV8411477.1 NADPH:quinone oxidoreductase family protein [Alphaproteobacteria bacterium]
MRAVQGADLQSADSYHLLELPTPDPGPQEVRVRISACGVGYVDALVALGRYQVRPKLPHNPGWEVSGWIDAIGDEVRDLLPGQRCLTVVRGGGFAEYALARAGDVVALPDNMRLDQAAGFYLNYGTALHALRDRAYLQPGEILLVIGAAGGVGLAAVQLGRLLGATVIAVASTAEKRALALKCGAALALDREPDGWRDRLREMAPGGIDVVFDPVSGPLLQPAFRSLRWRGRYLVVGFAAGAIPALPLNLPLLKGSALIGVDYRQFSDVFEAETARQELKELLGWVSEGRIDPPVGRRFPFEEYREALAFALSGKGSGKTILEIAPGP